MVRSETLGARTLTPSILVRIQVPQPNLSGSLKSMPFGGRVIRTPFALPASRAILRRRFAGFVAAGEHEHDHVANIARQIERAKARS